MKHIAAYLMLVVGGNAAPTADDVKNVLSAAGVDANEDDLGRLLTAVDGKVRVPGLIGVAWQSASRAARVVGCCLLRLRCFAGSRRTGCAQGGATGAAPPPPRTHAVC